MKNKQNIPIFILFTLLLIIAKPAFAESKKTVYLSFDADMTPYMKKELNNGKVKSWYDPKIISYLEENKIPAIIFVTGLFAETYQEEVKQWSNGNLSSTIIVGLFYF